MDRTKIEDEEILYRIVLNSYPDGFIDGKPTAALFIDSNGASVDRDGGRDEHAIVENFRFRFRNGKDGTNYNTAVKITAGQCRVIGTYPNPVNNHKNKYHAEIHESDSKREISFLKAAQLAAKCKIVDC